MTAQLIPTPIFRAEDNNGNPLAGGQLFTYQAGTTIPQTTFTDSTQVHQNTNPVILNARGEASVWMDSTLVYKFVLQDAAGNPIWTQDNVSGSPVIAGALLLGPVTILKPTTPVGTTLQVNLNGTGTANDVDVIGPFNGPNLLAVRATSTGTGARSGIAATDGSGLGVQIATAGTGFTGNIISGATTAISGALFTNDTRPLYLGTNSTANIRLDSSGLLTTIPPPSPIPVSVEIGLNGNGTGNDFDITGPLNGANVMALRATNAGTSARANIGATDASGHGILFTGVGAGFTGSVLTGATAGVAAAVSTNSSIPLYLGANNTASLQINPTGQIITVAPQSAIANSITISLNGNATANDIDILGPFNGANVAAIRATSGGTAARSSLTATDSAGHGVAMASAGTGFTGSLIAGAPASIAGAVFTNDTRPLYLGTNATFRLSIDGTTGALTYAAPTTPVPTSIQFNTNGTGGGNDFDIAGAFNGPNEFFMRATNAGTSAKSVVSAADNSSLGIAIIAAGAGYTGNLLSGSPTGRGGALQLNYNAPLSIGVNSSANMIIGSTAAAVGNDISARGVYLARFKASDQSIASSAVFNTDNDLQVAIGIGTFYFRFSMIVTTAAGGATPGLRFGVQYSGTCTNGAEYYYGFNGASFTGTGAANQNIAGVVAYNNNLGTTSIFLFEGTITVTTAGTFSLGWGQSVSSATAVVMKAGSTMQITQIS